MNNNLAGELIFNLSRSQTAALHAHAKQKQITPFVILSAVYGLILSKHFNQQKIVLNTGGIVHTLEANEAGASFEMNLFLLLDLM
jgi:hypothetical protein